MLDAEDWKYVQNQILVATAENGELMTEIISDTWPKLTAVGGADADWVAIQDAIAPDRDAWLASTGALAALLGQHALQTENFTNKLAELTVKPDPDTNSLGVQWESIVTSNVAADGPIYHYLLPDGRTGFSRGSYEQRITYVTQFGTRLAEQTTKPALATLATAVATYVATLADLRMDQTTTEGLITTARAEQEPLRIALAQDLHGVIGFGLWKWRTNPVQVASLFDLTLLRDGQQDLPAAPADSTWTAATRTLSTSTLPANATRLELWRQGPGGAPERLLIGDTGVLALAVPAEYTFTPGHTYQLWFAARNGRGTSAPGPKQSWTA